MIVRVDVKINESAYGLGISASRVGGGEPSLDFLGSLTFLVVIFTLQVEV